MDLNQSKIRARPLITGVRTQSQFQTMETNIKLKVSGLYSNLFVIALLLVGGGGGGGVRKKPGQEIEKCGGWVVCSTCRSFRPAP